ncbi:MAG: ArnT family glycosyltransferase, partial [Candidatus Hodarchaeota archaeon]
KVFHDWEFSAQMVSAIFGTLTLIPFYFLTRKLFNQGLAFISSIIFAFQPYLVRFSGEVIREPFFWFLFMMAIWFGWEAITKKKLYLFVLTSLFGSMSFLLRPEGIFVVPLIALWVFLSDFKKLRASYKRRILFTLTLLLTVPMLVFPAILYLKGKTGHWQWASIDRLPRFFSIDWTMDRIKKNFDKLEPKAWDDSPQGRVELNRLKDFLSLARDHRLAIVGIETASKFLKAIHPLLFIPLVFGSIKRKTIQYRWEEELFLLSAFSFSLLILVRYGTISSYIGTRHMMTPVILCLPWIGAGFVELEYKIKNSFLTTKFMGTRDIHLRNFRWVLLILIVFALLPKTLASQRSGKVPLKEAGIWLKEHGPSNPVIMGQGESGRRIAFYSDGTFLEIPFTQDLFEYAKEKRVDFLAVNEKRIEQAYPGLIGTLDPENFREEVIIGKSLGSYVIRIYSVRY